MKLLFFERSAGDRRQIFEEAAARLNVLPVIVEKDFWVSWVLALLFSHPEWSEHIVFKGGTSLSKVFGAIDRFSEDIDLSVSPSFLGRDEQWPGGDGISRTQRTKRMEELQGLCGECVETRIRPVLEQQIAGILGSLGGGQDFLEYQRNPTTQSPDLLFHYPSVLPEGYSYLPRSVKLEFGSLTDQRPNAKHPISILAQKVVPKIFDDFQCSVVALEMERTFWEKATILHAEYHQSSRMKPRFSRHYSDLAVLSGLPIAEIALSDAALRERVVKWKATFFASTGARYDLAVPGSFRLAPPTQRLADLRADYKEMEYMYPTEPMSFAKIIELLGHLEDRINGTAPIVEVLP